VVRTSCADCWNYTIITITDAGIKTAEFDQSALDTAPQSLKVLVTLLSDLSSQEALIKITTTPFQTGTRTASVKVMATSTPVGATPKARPTSIVWDTILHEDDGRVEIDVLQNSDELIIGAVKRFQLQAGTVPTDCAVFVIRGPMALTIGLFGPGWVERRYNMTEAAVASRIQDGINMLSKYCDKDKIQVVRVP
jgi:hypothetical protein